MGSIRILAFCNHALFDRLIVESDGVESRNSHLKREKREDPCDGDIETNGFEIVSHRDFASHLEGDQASTEKKLKFKLVLTSIEFAYFVYILQLSREYRCLVIEHWSSKARNSIPNSQCSTLSVTLTDPSQQVIDFEWGHRLNHLAMERSELDNAMSWFSTLGGAYSALGDEFTHCAQMAGRISLRQFQLAIRLGDPCTVARCKLYIALSLIQTNRFKLAKQIIQAQYHLAVGSSCPDIRLIRMCRGVWSKLRYEHSKHVLKTEVK